MHRHQPHREPVRPPRLRLVHPFARIVLGGTVAIAMLSAGAFVFGPFSDLSALQLTAGPHATGPANVPNAEQHQPAAASAPIARIARRDAIGP